MIELAATGDGSLKRRKVQEIAIHELNLKPLKVCNIAGMSDEHPHLCSCLQKGSYHGGSNKSSRPCDKNLHESVLKKEIGKPEEDDVGEEGFFRRKDRHV